MPTLLYGLTGEMQSHQRRRTGAVNNERRTSEVKGEGNPVGCNAHGRPGAVVMCYCLRLVIPDHLIVSVH